MRISIIAIALVMTLAAVVRAQDGSPSSDDRIASRGDSKTIPSSEPNAANKSKSEPRFDGGSPGGRDIVVKEQVLVTLIEQVQVPAEDTGPLAEIAVREGQTVKVGDTLARIKADEAQLELKRAKQDRDIATTQSTNDVRIRFAEKRLEAAQAELKRAEDSIAKSSKSISQSQMDKLRLDVESGELEVEQAKLDFRVAAMSSGLKSTEVEIAEASLKRRELLSPVDGKVVEIKLRRGEWVKPGDTVLRVVRLDRLQVEGFLHVTQLTDDFTGRPVTLTVDLPGRSMESFDGEVVFVSPEINPVSGEVRFRAELINKNGWLMPGLRGSLTIESAKPKAGE